MISQLLENDNPYATKVCLAILMLICFGGTVYIIPPGAISTPLHVRYDCDSPKVMHEKLEADVLRFCSAGKTQ